MASVVAVGLVLAGWTVISAVGVVDPLYLPSPGAVWDAFVRANTRHRIADGVDRFVIGEQGYYLWEHLLASLQRIAVGVGAAILLGPLVGFVMGMVAPVRWVAEPVLNFLRALPPLGYIGLLIVWFGIGDTSKIWLLFLAAFPPIAIATLDGVLGVKQDYLHAARSLGARRAQVVSLVVLPATLPNVLSGIRIATAFAWTTVVAAELNNGIPGIGGLAYIAGTQLNTPLTIACIIVIGVAALLLDAVIAFIGARVVPWKGKA
ncbi:ABC transporter permease [Nocardia sp. NPDC050717]|uniref:ABC transporter permease n=1 Tax=Nocardia sp. NPDC050717 TaxID=3157221 RepID=UPI0033CD4973